MVAYIIGLACITAGEVLFVSTGVEQFATHSLFGLIPAWLPFLWAYIFLSAKRILTILNA
jgi:hypothetical protein